MDEAMHPLTLMATGLYGMDLPNQDGAPLRLIVPWKYGFKGIKSIVKIEFVEKMPLNTWHRTASERVRLLREREPARRPSPLEPGAGAAPRASCASAPPSCSTATATRSHISIRGWTWRKWF